MSSPQIENGYTKIANEIMDALVKIRIPGQARQVLDFILRKTYGWNKKQDAISLSQFVKGTGLSKVAICKSINKLLEMNIITKKGNATSYFTKKGNDFTITYGFQKQYEHWLPLPKKVTLPKKVIRRYPKRVPQKTILQKKTYTSDSIEYRLANYLFNFILKRNQNFKKPDIQKWTRHIDLMIRIDNRDIEVIKQVIEWCQNDTIDKQPEGTWKGWASNILSTAKLREKFDVLFLKMQEQNQQIKSNTYGQTKEAKQKQLDRDKWLSNQKNVVLKPEEEKERIKLISKYKKRARKIGTI